MTADPVSIYVVHTGRPGTGLPDDATNFGWAAFRDGTAVPYADERNHSIDALAEGLVADLAEAGRRIALGFENVTWVPIPSASGDLLRSRGIADTAAPGATSAWCGRFGVWGLARSLQLVPWILSRVAEHATATTLPAEWSVGHHRLLLFEARVAGATQADRGIAPDGTNIVLANVQDAFTGAAAANDALLEGVFTEGREVVLDPPMTVEGGVVNLLGVAVLAAGMVSSPAVLDRPSLLVVPQRRRTGWAEAPSSASGS